MPSDAHLKAMLWTVACSLLFFWFFSIAVRSFYDAQTRATVYDHKICPAPQGYGGNAGR